MGKRGPKGKPAAISKAQGNPGRRPLGEDPEEIENTIDEPVAKVSPPEWLEGEALQIWKDKSMRLTTLKLLTATDAETFGRYCMDFANWLELQRTLQIEGLTYRIETASGLVIRTHPALSASNILNRTLMAQEASFGLNPADRQKIFSARASSGSTGDLFNNQPPGDKEPAASKLPTRNFLN